MADTNLTWIHHHLLLGSSRALEGIRVVHLNGYVENFEHPVSVSQVTGKPAKHFVCTPSQLLSTTTGSKLLKPDAQLELGKIYLLLPFSALQAEVSPMDLACVVKKLTAVAKTSRCEAKSLRDSPLMSPYGSTPVLNSPSRSPNRFVAPEAAMAPSDAQRSSRARSWKPILNTIREKSFNRGSESDLQEKHSEMVQIPIA
ncbi:hypothetical protein F2P56_017787 [Juglans regia]|uniref:Uncharacterized protein LOC109016081 n=2 Tax=Juglans regia TaxID=51240 RepID=A0A2I4HDE9_JUGRE|nr:uncharacterized protein LOC109016081 [Juglans regia]KAF5461712.1 hypothetical protein F2P56_017787 [Juglans regia]